jgi:hypothetical protein
MDALTCKVRTSEKANMARETSLIPNRKTCLFFQIELPANKADFLRLIIPVYNSDLKVNEEKKRTKDSCLFTSEVWNNLNINRKENGDLCVTKTELSTDNDNLGIINISDIPTGKDVTINLSFSEFTPDIEPKADSDTTGIDSGVACYLQKPLEGGGDDDYENIPDSSVRIRRIKAKGVSITAFKSSRYLVSLRDTYTLSWEVENATKIKLQTFKDGVWVDIDIEDKEKFTYRQPARKGTSINKFIYKLTATGEQENKAESSLTISVKSKTEIWDSGLNFGEGTTVLGMYNYQDEVYAVVYEPKTQASYLYVSGNGVSFEKVFPNATPNANPVTIGSSLATSPGLVHNNKLWLIGGSMFDPDKPGNDLGCFDFVLRKWMSIRDLTPSNLKSAPSRFPPRMGHSCVVVGDNMWVLGGYDPDSGVLNDIWKSSNGYDWQPVEQPTLPLDEAGQLPPGRCMMAATIFRGDLWLFGGFKEEPGGSKVFTDFYYYSPGDNAFKAVLQTNKTGQKEKLSLPKNVRAAQLAVVKDMLFLFFTYRDTYGSNNWALPIGEGNNIGEWNFKGYDQPSTWNGKFSNGHNIQATTFEDGVYLMELKRRGKSEIEGANVRRFYYSN